MTILFGPSGCGKTTLIWDAVVSHALGRPFLNAFPFQGRECFLVYDWEQNTQQTARLLRRLRMEGIPEQDTFFYCMNLEGVNLATEEGRAVVQQDAVDFGATCLIFDSRDSAFGYIDENEGRDVAKAMDPVKRLATELDLAIVSLAHEPKGQYQPVTSKVRGHTSWVDKTDQLFHYQPRGDLRLLQHGKARGVEACTTLLVKLMPDGDAGHIRLESSTVDDKKGIRAARAEEQLRADISSLEDCLEQRGPQTSAQLMDSLRFKRHRFDAALRASGRVVKEGGHRGRYTLSPSSSAAEAAV